MSTMILNNTISIEALLKAQAFFNSAITEAQTDLEKAGAIQAFEFSYELAWKTMKRILAHRGIELASPREVFRAAAQEKLIDDPETWFGFIKMHNLTTHTYNTDTADEVFEFLPTFANALNKFIRTIKGL